VKTPYLSIVPDLLQKRKVRETLLAGSVFLLAGASFGLGRLSVDRPTPLLCEEVSPAGSLREVTEEVTRESSQKETVQKTSEGNFVASQTGSAYYALWCAGASRIKQENKVFFTTKEEAEQAGYAPAKNCKGM
jgi:hypothetical protein